MKYEDISIIFLLYKTPEKLINNLKNYKKFNVLILDQSNDLELKKKIEKKFPKLQYYGLSNTNRGFAKGINFLVKKVKTKYFLCTQPDILISQKSILKLKKTLLIKKEGVIAVPKILGFKNYEIKKKIKKRIYTVKNIVGAIFLAEKKKFSNLKMLDESFFFYWEDVDLCKRIEKSKFKIFINLNSTAKHYGGTSTEFNLKTFFIRMSNFKYGEYLFQHKHKQLKFVKVLREPISNFLFAIFYIATFRPKKFFEKIFYNCGIVKFIVYKMFTNKF